MSQTAQTSVFLDNVGRTIIGKIVEHSDSTVLAVENPALLHVQVNQQNGQLHLQLLPLFFKEFLADKDKPTVWLYKRDNVVLAQDIEYSPQLIMQYEQMFPLPSSGEPKVVKLFDDE